MNNLVTLKKLWQVAKDKKIDNIILELGYANDLKKKYYVILKSNPNKKIKFGQYGASDFLIHKDPERRRLYRLRHKHDKINNPNYPGYYSYHLLW